MIMDCPVRELVFGREETGTVTIGDPSRNRGAVRRSHLRVRDFCGQSRYLALSREPSIHVRTGNFRRATRAGRDLEAKAMQFDDRGDHAQPQAQTFDVSTFV
jgi:hypothetical protein